MKAEKTNEIKNFKRARTVFAILGCALALAVLIYVVVTVTTNPDFNTNCIIALSVFGSYTLIMLLLFTVFDLRRQCLVNKYFGKVSAADIEKSKKLLGRIECVKRYNYSFFDDLDDGRFEFSDKMLKHCLKEISKGRKVFINNVRVYFDIQSEIEKSPQKDNGENKDFNAYITELVELLDRNKSDI